MSARVYLPDLESPARAIASIRTTPADLTTLSRSACGPSRLSTEDAMLRLSKLLLLDSRSGRCRVGVARAIWLSAVVILFAVWAPCWRGSSVVQKWREHEASEQTRERNRVGVSPRLAAKRKPSGTCREIRDSARVDQISAAAH